MKDNLATTFLLPLLGLPKDVLRSMVGGKRRIINCFLYDDSLEAYKTDHLFLVHRNIQDIGFQKWDNLLIGQEHCIESYDIMDSLIGVKVFNMTPYEDYYTFLEGKYSKYSEWGKQRCTEHGINTGLVAKQIIEKSESLKKELSIKFGVEDLSVFEECAPLWNQAMISNVLDDSTREYLAKVVGYTKFKQKISNGAGISKDI